MCNNNEKSDILSLQLPKQNIKGTYYINIKTYNPHHHKELQSDSITSWT